MAPIIEEAGRHLNDATNNPDNSDEVREYASDAKRHMVQTLAAAQKQEDKDKK